MGYEIRYYAPGMMCYGFGVRLQYLSDEETANNAARELLGLDYDRHWEIEDENWSHCQYAGVAVHKHRTAEGYRLNAYGYGSMQLRGNAVFRVAEAYPGGELIPCDEAIDYAAV